MAEDFQTWKAWHEKHQPFELAWWKEAMERGHSVDDVEFAKHWQPVRDFLNPNPFVFTLDIGCGPRPPFAAYCGAVIEPLAIEYRKITPPEWWHSVTVYAQPAERLIKALVGCADMVICWNCIDHAVGWREILGNMAAYGHERTIYGLATDFHEPFLGHPGFERDEFMHEVEKRFEILEYRAPFGRDLALRMRLKQGERQ